MHQTSKPFRILGISLSTRGFGYAVIENEASLIAYGNKKIVGNKNIGSLAGIRKVIVQNQPETMVLPDVNHAKGTRRVARIKALHKKVLALAKKKKIKAVIISGKKLRSILLGNEYGTKHEMAAMVAQQFPDELALLLPPKRTVAMRENPRMDIFDAVELVVALRASDKLLRPNPAGKAVIFP